MEMEMISNPGFGEIVGNPKVVFIEMYVDCTFHGVSNDFLILYI